MPFIPRQSRNIRTPQKKAFEGYQANETNFYSNAPWRKLRAVHLMQHPLCAICQENGQITTATTVDHIKPINKKDPYNTEFGKYGEALNPANLQSLCLKCHNTKSGKEKRK